MCWTKKRVKALKVLPFQEEESGTWLCVIFIKKHLMVFLFFLDSSTVSVHLAPPTSILAISRSSMLPTFFLSRCHTFYQDPLWACSLFFSLNTKTKWIALATNLHLVKTVTYKCKASLWLGASAKHPHTICLCHAAKEKYRKPLKRHGKY